MKKILVLVMACYMATLLVFNSCNKNSVKSPEQPYGEKSGIITYKPMDMMGMLAVQTIYFDDYGRLELRETKIDGNGMGMEIHQHTCELRNGNIAYHYDLRNDVNGVSRGSKTAYKMTIDKVDLEQMNISALSPYWVKKLNFKEEGNETVAGLKGNKYSLVPDSTQPQNIITGVQYKNLPLKLSMGSMVMEAEKVEFGVSIPADKFKVPQEFEVKDAPPNGMPEMPEEEDTTSGMAPLK